MAEKRPIEKREQFEEAVYDLGLKLIDDYRAGTYRDPNKTLDAIVELFRISQGAGRFFTEVKSNGI